MKYRDIELGERVIPLKKFRMSGWGVCTVVDKGARGILTVQEERTDCIRRHYILANKVEKETAAE